MGWRLLIISLSVVLSLLPLDVQARDHARSGASPEIAQQGFRKLESGETWSYKFQQKSPGISSSFKSVFQGWSNGRAVFYSIGTHRLDAARARRVDAAAEAGRVQIISKKGRTYQLGLRLVFDAKGRLVERQHISGNEIFKPHDCQTVEGTCRYSLTDSEIGDTIYLVRRSTYRDGVWYFQVNVDPTRDPSRSDNLLETGEISFGTDGVVMDSVRFRGGKTFSWLELK